MAWITEGSTGLMFAPRSVAELSESLAKAIDGSLDTQRLVMTNVGLVREKADIQTNLKRLEKLLEIAMRNFS